ncbi:MAG: hypothetical protein LBP61_02580, partial [Desulfovibrio sp.]|nr:hypothetical protein [Desulfovibrio sp.]
MTTFPFPKPAPRRAPALRTGSAAAAKTGPSPDSFPHKKPGQKKTPSGAEDSDNNRKFRKRHPDRKIPAPHAPRESPPTSSSRETPSPDSAETSLLLSGIKPVLELLESAPERLDSVFLRKGRHVADMERILDRCRKSGVRFSLLDADRFARLYPGGRQGVVARLYETGFTPFEDLLPAVTDAPLPLLLFLDQVQDPGNAGTLARTLYALGGAGLVIPRHNGVYLGAGAARSSAGALAHLPVAKVPNLGQAMD